MKLKHYYFVIMHLYHLSNINKNEVSSLSVSENFIRKANNINTFIQLGLIK